MVIRKIVTLLVFLMLPFQATWAAVAPYCLHEVGTAALHLGHHNHEHNEPENSEKRDNNSEHLFANIDLSASSALTYIDSDCGVCHLNCGSAILTVVSSFESFFAASQMTNVISSSSEANQSRPERPKWPSLA